MAEQYDNTNTFALFKNDKGDNEKRPDYTGTITLEGGKEMRLSAWIRESKAGNTFMSGQVSEPYEGGTTSAPVETITNMKDDVPF
jgi:uncharacterized protein (DUF736 family)